MALGLSTQSDCAFGAETRVEGRESRALEEDFLPRISRINTDAGGVERPESSVERSPEAQESFAERMEWVPQATQCGKSLAFIKKRSLVWFHALNTQH